MPRTIARSVDMHDGSLVSGIGESSRSLIRRLPTSFDGEHLAPPSGAAWLPGPPLAPSSDGARLGDKRRARAAQRSEPGLARPAEDQTTLTLT
jgi:hypothetical protein